MYIYIYMYQDYESNANNGKRQWPSLPREFLKLFCGFYHHHHVELQSFAMPLHIDELVDHNNESDLTISLRRERNKLTSLGSLPSELVIMICEYILDPAKPRTITSLMHICSYVYYAALSSSRL
jgi:hypothetical protein